MIFNSSSLTISKTKESIHNEAAIISEKAKIISTALGVVYEGLYKGHSTMTNYIYIDTDIDKMVNVLVTYDVLYFMDDFFGEDTIKGELPNLSKIVSLWKGETSHSSNSTKLDLLYRSISYVSKTLSADCPSFFFDKYSNSVMEHLSFSLKNKKYNTVNEYLEIRLRTGGMYLLIDLIEYVHTIYLSKEILNNETLSIKKLQNYCALIGSLSNDIFSYAKEKHSNYNLINAYLITNEAASYNDAVLKSINRVNSTHTDYQLTIKKARLASEMLPINEKQIVEKYLNALDVIVASSYHWQKSTNRYYHPENVFVDMKIALSNGSKVML